LNKESRKRELQKITKQNQQILKRIQESRPTYDHLLWKEQAKVNNQVLLNICEFKPKKLAHLSSANYDKKMLVGYDDDIY